MRRRSNGSTLRQSSQYHKPISSEIEFEKLIVTLLRTALEHAGAERGLLALARGAELRIEAEATTSGDKVIVHVRDESMSAVALPASLLNYVQRTGESVLLDDAAAHSPFAEDPHIRRRQTRSVLCLPLLNQAKSVGVLYLENNLAPRVFAPSRIAVLKLLASQAATALQNARLYRNLEEGERKTRRLIDANIIGISTWDLDGRILDANEAFLQMINYSREDVVSGLLRWTDLTAPEWRDLTFRMQSVARRTGVCQPYEKEYFRKDGSRVPVLVGSALFDEQHGQGVSFVLDLTERKRAEDVLRESEARLERAQRVARVGWWERDFATNKVHLSDEASRIFGIEPVDLPEWHDRWLKSIHPEDRPRAAEAAAAALRGGSRYDVEYRVVRPDGVLRMVHSQGDVTWDDSGRPLRQFGVMQDITELRQAEEALRRSEAYLAEAQRLSHTGTSVFDATRTVYWSEESYRIFGLDPLRGVPDDEAVMQRIHADDRDRVREALRDASRLKREYLVDYRVVLPDGTRKHLQSTGHPLFSADGELLEYVATHVEVTERVRAQEQAEKVRQLESDLAHMNRLSIMGELTASLSHEILHPIATARNNARAAARFLDMSPPDLGEVRDALSCIVRDADRAKDIVGRVRDHVKKAPPRRDQFEVNEAIEEVIVMVRSAVDKSKVSVRTDFIANSISVEGDRVQLQQVILNLILNAIEAMNSVEEGARELSISTEQNQTSGVLIAVRDSGPGIDQEHFERVFDPFYTTKTSGLGMGLAICRSIIDAHGGRLWVGANEPRGAVFQFTLPAAQLDL